MHQNKPRLDLNAELDKLRQRVAELEAAEKKRTTTLNEMDQPRNLHQGLWVMDREFYTTFVNSRMATMLGYTAEEMLGKRFFSFVDDQSVENAKQAVEWRQQGIQKQYDCEFLRKDGSRIFTLLETSSMMDSAGVVAEVTEVTVHQPAEQALRDRAEQYDVMTSISMDGFWVINTENHILDVNDAYCRMTGYSRDELLTMKPSVIEAQESPNEMAEHIQRIMEMGVDRFESRHHCKDGRVIDVEVSVTFMPQQQRFLAFFRDITAHKQAEMALRESEWRNKIISDLITDYVFVVDVGLGGTLNLRWASENLWRMTGRTQAEVATADMWKTIIHPEDVSRFFRFVNRVVAQASEGEFECRTFTGDGKERWIRVFAQPQTDDRNVVVTVVGAVQEITGRKRAEEALEKRLVALTKPLETSETIAFEDLFNLPDIQRLQDEFSTATGVASIITRTDGTPITAPSNFCRLCKDIIRKTDKGYINCLQSDAVLGSFNLEGPTIQPCLSGGLWDAGAAISVGGKHIANWLIGQVRDETQTEEKIRAYARIIGVDETLAVDAFHEVPAMSREKFGQVSRALFTLANQLSSIAYQNVQQARFITERQQAEEALRQSEARLKMTLQSTQVGTWEWNIQTGETVFNERWAEIVGYTLAELSPTNVQTWSNFIHPDDLSIAYQRLDTHFAGESSHYEGEFRMKHRHGHWVWVWYRGMVMEWTVDGKPLRMFGTHIDITSRKQSEEKIERYQTHLEDMVKQRTVELEAANEQLLILSRVKDEFVSNVSHELRTPLTNLTLRYHLVETHPEQIEKHMGVIQREMARLAQTIENLLSLSRLDQGRIAVSLATVDLNEIIDHYVMDRTLVFNAKGLSLDFHQEPELPEIIADRGMLGQVLSILLTNANNYTPTGGRVMVSTHTRHELDRQWVGFSVSDTGPGISPDDQLKLFTRFFRGKVGRQSRVPGTGLGLAIAKEIVALHEGYIEVESDGMPGQGVTFTVWLPVKKEEKPVA